MNASTGVRLPTTRADWRLVGRTAWLVLSIPAYAGLAALFTWLTIGVFVFSRNLSVLRRVILFGDLPVVDRLRMFVAMYPGLGISYTLAQSALLLATAALVGVNLAIATYHLRTHRASLRKGSGSVGGVVLGTLGAGCASCGSALLVGLLSLAGASGVLAVLPLDGLEFALLAVCALLLSTFWIADGMRGGTVAGCPIPADDR